MARRVFWLIALSLVVGGAAFSSLARGEPAPTTSQPASAPSKAIDASLVKRLLGGQSSTLDTVESTLEQMHDASKRLSESLDPGRQTQQVQKKIVDGIDQLIEQARRNRVSGGQQQQTARRTGDRPAGRRRPQPMRGKDGGSGQNAANKPGSGGKDDKSGTAAGQRRSDKAELSRGWGYLPQRDRNEISQGFDDEFPGKYREEIIRYYRDLAEAAKEEKPPQ